MSHLISITFANSNLTWSTRSQAIHLLFSDEQFDEEAGGRNNPFKLLMQDMNKALEVVGVKAVSGKKMTIAGIGYRVEFFPQRVKRRIEARGNDKDWRAQLIMAMYPRLLELGYELISHTQEASTAAASYLFKQKAQVSAAAVDVPYATRI